MALKFYRDKKDPNLKLSTNDKIRNWNQARLEMGGFENQLGDGQFEKGVQALDNLKKVSRQEMVDLGFDGASSFQLPANVPLGMYSPEDNAYFAEPTLFQKMTGSKQSSTDIHERAHAFDIGTTGTPGSSGLTEEDIKSNIQRTIEGIPVKKYKGQEMKTSDYRNSKEIYADLTKFRLENNINPKKVFTKEDLPELREKLKKEKSYGAFNINDIYEDDGILKLMNEVADNSNNKTSTDLKNYT